MHECRQTEAVRSLSKKPVPVHVCNAASHVQKYNCPICRLRLEVLDRNVN